MRPPREPNPDHRRARGGWVRRRALPALSALVALLGLALAAAFLVSRILTDAALWTQYLWWVPVLWWLMGAWGLLAASWAFGRLAARRRGAVLRRALLVVCLVMSVFVIVWVWRAPRMNVGVGPAPEGTRLRVLHWNIAAFTVDPDASGRAIRRLDPDLAVLVNARLDGQRQALHDATRSVLPESSRGPGHELRLGANLILSERPIRRAGIAWLTPDAGARTRDTGADGWVCMLELERAGGGSLVVWVVDLPSEPTLSRQDTIRAALDAARREPRNVRTLEGDRWMWRDDASGLDAPDLILGDFNTSRGSSSLARFDAAAPSGRYLEGFDEVGTGRARSWIPTHPNRALIALNALGDWHIDLALLDARHAFVGYALVDLGPSSHRAQVVDVSLAPARVDQVVP